LLKGLLTVFVVKSIFGENFLNEMISLVSAVLAHCYSPWIKFKGGRGLATAAGGALILSIPVLVIWGVIWVIAFAFRRNIHFANSSASLLSSILAFTSSDILIKYTNPQPDSELQFGILIAVLFVIILSKHIQPLKEYFILQQNKKLKEQKDE
jgi:glycerol-3-phosphate acyltransferase PlsY